MIDLFLYFVIIAMFDKKYILKAVYRVVCLDIVNEDKRVEFWLSNFNDSICEDIQWVIDFTRNLERRKDFYVDAYNNRLDKTKESK